MTHRSHRAEHRGDGVPLDRAAVQSWPLPIVEDGGDKHARGTVLVVGGSPETPGAVVLAGIAALRMGAGRLQIATAAVAAPAVGIAVPESIALPLPVDAESAFVPDAAEILASRAGQASAVVIGPGMRGPVPVAFVAGVLGSVGDDAVVVVDALALQCVSSLPPDVLEPLRGRLVITPNREELERIGCAPDAIGELAAHLGAVVSSFGSIVTPDGRCWECVDSTPGLGTSGSGDVLAGLIGGAAARCGDAVHAAVWGTYAHAAAGSRLSERMGRVGFLARELLEELPRLWADLDSDPDPASPSP